MPERCIDASVAVKWVVQAKAWRKKARRLLLDALQSAQTLIAPPLFAYETESVLQERLYTQAMTVAEVDAALQRLAVINVQLVTHPELVIRACAIARRCNQPRIYDSLYAALAELHGCEFWTADRRFYEAARTALPFVKYLPHYP